MATVQAGIVTPAFIDLAVFRAGMAPTSDMSDNAFLTLNQIIASAANEQVMALAMLHAALTPVAGTVAYTFGVGGTFNTAARPVRVTGWKSASGAFAAGGLILSHEDLHAKIANDRGRTSVLAEMVAADGNFPLINVEVFPAPAASPGTLTLDYWTPLAQFAALSTDMAGLLADGYEQWLREQLAVSLYSQYGRPGVSLELLATKASNSKAVIMARNAATLGLQQKAA